MKSDRLKSGIDWKVEVMDELAKALVDSGVLDSIYDTGIDEKQLMNYIDALNRVDMINPVSYEDLKVAIHKVNDMSRDVIQDNQEMKRVYKTIYERVHNLE